MGRFEYLIEKQRRERRLRRIAARFEPLSPRHHEAEWRPARLGRLGRVLWRDIDRYLEFVEIARASPTSATPETQSDEHARSATYSLLD